MAADTEELALTKRQLIVRDSLAFLTLVLITAALFAITLFLFRSFTAHRADLARQWSERGQAALAQGKAEQAVAAFRTALTYAPGDHADELAPGSRAGRGRKDRRVLQLLHGIVGAAPRGRLYQPSARPPHGKEG